MFWLMQLEVTLNGVNMTLLKSQSEIDKAIRDAEHAVLLNGNLSPVRTTMGMIYRGKGDYTAAEKELIRAIELNPR